MNTLEKHSNQIIRKEVTQLIKKGHAHCTFEESVENLSLKNAGEKPNDLPYSIWKLVEHLRITQWDILEFSKYPNHQSPNWPDDYWPNEDYPADQATWEKSLQLIVHNRNEFIALLNNAAKDLYEPFPYGDGQNLLREALLIADHNSYHIGQIVVIRRLLNDWT